MPLSRKARDPNPGSWLSVSGLLAQSAAFMPSNVPTSFARVAVHQEILPALMHWRRLPQAPSNQTNHCLHPSAYRLTVRFTSCPRLHLLHQQCHQRQHHHRRRRRSQQSRPHSNSSSHPRRPSRTPRSPSPSQPPASSALPCA